MSRETKLGYGFLLVGTGLPYLIDNLLGPIAALIVAALCLVGGIGFLVAGHMHRDRNQIRRRGVMATIGMFTIVGAISGALIGGLSGAIWSVARKATSTVGTAAPAPSQPLLEKPSIESTKEKVPSPHLTTSNKGAPATTGPNIISPDPYAGKDDKTVANWAIEKADQILASYQNCNRDIAQGDRNLNDGKQLSFEHPGPDLMAATYWKMWDQRDRDALAKLHASLTYRLGPDAEGNKDFEYLMVPRIQSKVGSEMFVRCTLILNYAPHLKKMGETLRDRQEK